MGFFIFFILFVGVILWINKSLPDSVKKNTSYSNEDLGVNPATGLPMTDGGYDIAGNLYGFNNNDDLKN